MSRESVAASLSEETGLQVSWARVCYVINHRGDCWFPLYRESDVRRCAEKIAKLESRNAEPSDMGPQKQPSSVNKIEAERKAVKRDEQ